MKNSTKIFALFGKPVGHSLSPFMHNATYKKMLFNAIYISLSVKNVEEALEHIKKSNIFGGSITIPHKETFIAYCEEISESSKKIGAINTIVTRNGKIKGYNTDWTGLTQALQEALTIKGKKFCILGAGGAARAAVFGIIQEGGIPIVLNRTIEKGEGLSQEFGCDFYPLDDIGAVKADCLINTTSVGMMPHIDRSPVAATYLSNFRYVMDIIYNPLRTKLLREADKAGCITLSGVSMFVHQGAEQIKIWTGLEPPRDYMKNIVMERLTENDINQTY